VRGYANCAGSHQAIARAVAQAEADVGVGTLAIASIYGLDFVPLRRVRFDLALKTEFLQEDSIRQLLETLRHRRVLQQLHTLSRYDTAHTGEIVAQL
jgi:putative molybdopterin biosynthesis protein